MNPSPVVTNIRGRAQVDQKTVHPEYNDSNADLSLVSNDNVVIHVHSFYLKAHSNTFRELLTDIMIVNADQLQMNRSPIPLDASSIAVQLFLDFMDLNKTRHIVDIDHIAQTLQLCQQFECSFLFNHILGYMADPAEAGLWIAPWKVFCIAARFDHLGLAKAAIGQMDYEQGSPPQGRWDIEGMTAAFAEDCNMRYLLGFLRVTTAHCKPAQKAKQSGKRSYDYDWDAAAKDFRVERTPVKRAKIKCVARSQRGAASATNEAPVS
ncbi:hypothetical protein BD324DRAFT_126844 [Kockovaella imperatae]|uniref:BTB domain-containing protein n=1 Tax=Kockovaella imperatae TaxID=4999 RepID=A0A1Y1U9G8_9TREE|nr:hypothetical protein BD324DRAFT_126844 [Kockovaella imperatae]ORX34679.1 hypothetical protein BD324DRAFT_126844 [Kockovaella imperatae]